MSTRPTALENVTLWEEASAGVLVEHNVSYATLTGDSVFPVDFRIVSVFCLTQWILSCVSLWVRLLRWLDSGYSSHVSLLRLGNNFPHFLREKRLVVSRWPTVVPIIQLWTWFLEPLVPGKNRGRSHSAENHVCILLAMEAFKSLHTQDKGERLTTAEGHPSSTW